MTFKNPETVLAFLGLVALGLFLLRPVQSRLPALNGILILSTLPLLFFGHRYIPMHSFTLWDKIRAGGPEQQRVTAELQPRGPASFGIRTGSAMNVLFPGPCHNCFAFMHWADIPLSC